MGKPLQFTERTILGRMLGDRHKSWTIERLFGNKKISHEEVEALIGLISRDLIIVIRYNLLAVPSMYDMDWSNEKHLKVAVLEALNIDNDGSLTGSELWKRMGPDPSNGRATASKLIWSEMMNEGLLYLKFSRKFQITQKGIDFLNKNVCK